VWKDVKRAAAAFRIPQNVAPHSFRKVYAVDLLKKYGDIDRVRRALNHRSETITMIYALADMQLAAKYRRRRRAAGRKLS
jgi:site-specific recombinase XerC